MKKNVLLLGTLMIVLGSCTSNNQSDQSNSQGESSGQQEKETWNMYNEDYSSLVSLDTVNDEDAKTHLPEDGSYETTTFTYDNVKYLETYINNKKVDNDSKHTTSDDIKYIYYNDNLARFVSLADGYAISLPTTTTLNGDFSVGKYRSKIYNEETTLTISKESSNPYGNTLSSWQTYRDEWLLEYLHTEKASNWLEENRLQFTKKEVFENTTLLKNYSISEYCVEIQEPGLITKNFYNIAVMREKNSYINFYLLVMKSNKNRDEEFTDIIKSFTVVDSYGTANNNTLNNLPAEENPNWNEATKKYYQKLLSQQTVDWGFYNGNLPSSGSDATIYERTQKKYKDAFNCDFQIASSYAHISYNNGFKAGRFPKDAAAVVCGDGFDGKPVIQFNYQFTNNNNNLDVNNTTDNFSPMFDILRGDNGNTIDFFSYQNDAEYSLKILARDIKAYGKPVLFRLNNEMNSDWTSYCGIYNLLDPDLFAASWRRLYKIFDDEGVDNCIWIFNPFTPGTPYSSWGKDLCYFPGMEYVQVLGLTYYVMNNENEATTKTFKKCYSIVYENNKDIWGNYPWIISEFACGSGGATTGTLYRNQASQAQWVSDMFYELSKRDDYCKNIKGAVWFSANDYSGSKVSNSLEIVVDKLPNTVAAFVEGLGNK